MRRDASDRMEWWLRAALALAGLVVVALTCAIPVALLVGVVRVLVWMVAGI